MNDTKLIMPLVAPSLPAILLLTCFLHAAVTVSGQKVFYDKKDPFTGERTLITKPLNYGKHYQISGSWKVNDSGQVFYLNLIEPSLLVTTTTTDSSVKECKLKLASGKIITGKWSSTVATAIGLKAYNLNSYAFTQEDAKHLIDESVTDIKTNTLLLQIPIKDRGKIGKIVSALSFEVK